MLDTTNALARLKEALAACPHPRGSNGQPASVEIENEATGEMVAFSRNVFMNPLVELFSDDIAAVCDGIPHDRRDRIVTDLRRGQRPYMLRREQPHVVMIKVDDAYHLRDLAEAALADGTEARP